MAEMNEAQRHKLKKFVKELKQYRGRNTELVSVYVPSGYDINKIIQHISQEQGTAANIKSTATRKNVIDALERLLQHLKLFTATPENGLALFSGNVAEREGESDVKIWSLEPPMPINMRLYKCDKEFMVEPLEEMLESKEVYGMVVMDKRDATIALLQGKKIIPITRTHSAVPGKFKTGGQSAQRFARIREGAAKDHYKKVAEYMKNEFLGRKNLKGILVGGPGPTKYTFVEGNYITNEIREKIIAIRDISYTDQSGLHELLENCSDVLASKEVAEEKNIMDKYFKMLAKEPNKIVYGENETMEKLQMGAVETLLLSDDLDDEKIERFDKAAKETSSEVRVISTETKEGAQLRDFGMIGAILRYPA